MPDLCWDCDHPISDHSSEYPGSDLRSIPRSEWPEKQPGQGCTVEGCECRRWFTIGPDWRDDPVEFKRRAKRALGHG